MNDETRGVSFGTARDTVRWIELFDETRSPNDDTNCYIDQRFIENNATTSPSEERTCDIVQCAPLKPGTAGVNVGSTGPDDPVKRP